MEARCPNCGELMFVPFGMEVICAECEYQFDFSEVMGDMNDVDYIEFATDYHAEYAS